VSTGAYHCASPVQRLFSMFPNGWPGTGLLLLRIASGALLIRQGLIGPHSIVIEPLEAIAGILLIAGLWTPVAGIVVVVCQLWTAITVPDDLQSAVLIAAISAALAMLGPGSTSLDNLLFGRRRFDVQKP
jgi:putative oxidoreductase